MPLRIRPAVRADRDALQDLRRAFCAEDPFPFDPEASGQALDQLLERPDWGGVLLAEEGGRAAGYAVWTLGFSLEFGGRDALLDELYVAPEDRRRGLGAALITAAEGSAAAAGAHSLHLEAMHGAGVVDYYRRLGFAPRPSTFMTRPVRR